ncbi:hypothetical protein CQJ94_21910 [Glycomyces fuscus]|nr:hypothetical protein CQJ94_21910 [Glycomyces fuscus]
MNFRSPDTGVELQVEGEVPELHRSTMKDSTWFPVPPPSTWTRPPFGTFRALLNAERQRRGTHTGTRVLTCYKQAALILRWFYNATSIDILDKGNHISKATGYRYVDEGVDVLTDQAPGLHEVLEHARPTPEDPLILDGKLFPCDRYSELGPTDESDL